MNIEKISTDLMKDKTISTIVSKIGNSSLSIAQRKELLIAFNNHLSNIFKSDINLCFIDDEDDNNDFKFFIEDNIIAINKVNKNPYYYLHNLLNYYFAIMNHVDEDNVLSIGKVEFSQIYFSSFPSIILYDKDNYKYLLLATDIIKKFIKNNDSEYAKEYSYAYDFNLSNESKQLLNRASLTLDNELKAESYDKLLEFNSVLESIIKKRRLTKEELALFSISDFLLEYKNKFTYYASINSKNQDLKIKEHIKQYFDEFFTPFNEYLNVNVKEGEIYINDTLVDDYDLIIDIIFDKITQINKKENIYSKIELNNYFYSTLQYIDWLLEGNDLGLINYVSFTKMYKQEDDVDIYKENYNVFAGLLNDEKFIGIVKEYLNSDNINIKLLNDIVAMMNKVYFNANIILNIEKNQDRSSLDGSSYENKIWLNLNGHNKYSVLLALFHEYRHCMQHIEIKENHHIFNDYIYSYLKENNYITPLSETFSYTQLTDYGYNNEAFYEMQPMEYDAEYFADHMIRALKRVTKEQLFNHNKYLASNYTKKYKYFNNGKRSLLLYDEYLRLAKVKEYNKIDEDNYAKLVDDICLINTLEDAIKIFINSSFCKMSLTEKYYVYKKIAGDDIEIECIGEKNIKINGEKYNFYTLGDYGVLEKILVTKANLKIRNRELSISDKYKYIFRNIIRFKPNNIDGSNLFNIPSYCLIYEKYRLLVDKDKKARCRNR